MLVADVLARFLTHCRMAGYSAGNTKDRQKTYEAFNARYAGLTTEEARPFHLDDWIGEHTQWSASTRHTRCAQIQSAMNWAVQMGRLDRNPFGNLRYEHSQPRAAVPDEHLEDILALATKWVARVLRWLRWTGCRLGEAIRMTWANVNLEGCVVTMEKHKTQKKTKKPRKFTFPDQARAMLLEIQAEQPVGYQGLIFLTRTKLAWTKDNFEKQFKAVAAKALHPEAQIHGLRHRYGTTGARNHRGGLKMLSLQMGHSSVRTTEDFYCHLDDDLEGMREAGLAALPKEAPPGPPTIPMVS